MVDEPLVVLAHLKRYHLFRVVSAYVANGID